MISKNHLTEKNLDMIDQEIEIMVALNHPKLIDVKKTKNNWYLIFEYCE